MQRHPLLVATLVVIVVFSIAGLAQLTLAATATTIGTNISTTGNLTVSGNVGIGTTTPYSLLSISNSASTAVNTALFTIASTTAGTATSTLFTVLANGYVGIGTTSPSGFFEISNTDSIYRIYKGAGAPNILAGYSGNSIGTGANVRANIIAGGGYLGLVNKMDGVETRYATISGGYDNYIDGVDSTTDLDGTSSVIGGGSHHIIKATHATISGGSTNTINSGSDYAAIVGGVSNIAGAYAVAGGNTNTASGMGSVAFGTGNVASGAYSTAIGATNTAGGDRSFAWGKSSTATGEYSTAFGRGLTVNGAYSVGIALDNMTGTILTPSNVLSIIGGNVGIGTTSPASLLTVSAGASATTTVEFGDQYSASSKSCFNVKTSAGASASFYFNASGLVFEANRCR